MRTQKTQWIAIIGVLTSLVAGVMAFYIQFVGRQYAIEAKLHDATRYELKDLSDRLKAEIIPEIKKEMVSQANNSSSIVAAEKFASIEKRIDEVDSKTLGLRQAINPIKPDEVLTIARLTDEVKSIRKDFKDLQSQIRVQQQSFESSILREFKSSNDSTTLILVVLVPLILNFLYTVWKDIKKGKIKDDS
jgi:hypothetical protein